MLRLSIPPGDVFHKHPTTKEKIVGFKVPMFKEAIELVKEAAMIIPEIGYVGWDIAISTNGPVIVEGNSYPRNIPNKT